MYIIYDSKYIHTPVIVDKAFYLNSKLSSSVYEYSNQNSQRVFLVGVGPSFKLGNLKRDFLDYTYLSIMPEFIDKKGESPFRFDNLDSDSRIKFVYKQQFPVL